MSGIIMENDPRDQEWRDWGEQHGKKERSMWDILKLDTTTSNQGLSRESGIIEWTSELRIQGIEKGST